MKLNDQSPMPIGKKYWMIPMEKVPADYLLWFWDECKLWDRARLYSDEAREVHDYIKENFSALETECPDLIINHRP